MTGLLLLLTRGTSYCQNGSSAGVAVNGGVPPAGVFGGLMTLLWLDATPQAKVLNGIILLALVYSVIVVVRTAAQLKSDIRALDDAQLFLDSSENEPVVMNLEALERITRVGDIVPEESTVVNRWRAVWRTMSKHPDRAGQSLAGCEELREETRADVPAYFSTVFVLMGLFGTVWGLSDAIAPLGKALSQMASGAPLTDIGTQVHNVTKSLSTAFSCTMTGVLATITLSTTHFFAVSRKQTRFLADLELFIGSEIVPRLTHPSAEQSLGDLAEATKTVTADLDKILDKAQKSILDIAHSAEQLGGGLRKELEEVGKQIGDAAGSLSTVGTQLAGSVAEFNDQHMQFRKFVENTTANLRSETLAIHQTALDTLAEIGVEHKRFLEQAQQEYTRFYSSTDQVCNELGQSAAALQNIAIYAQSMMQEDGDKDGYEQAVMDQLSRQAEGIGEMSRHLGHLVRLSAETLQQIRQSRDGADKGIDRFARTGRHSTTLE